MSYAEEQAWWGLEDLAMDALIEQEENAYYIVLIGYKGHEEYLIDCPFYSMNKAMREAAKYTKICKKIKVFHGKPFIEIHRTVWVCGNGTLVLIEDMKTTHIKNCIAMIERSVKANRPWRIEYLKSLQKELEKRQK